MFSETRVVLGLNEAWMNVFVKQTNLIIRGAGRENAFGCGVAHSSWTSHQGSTKSAACWVGWDRGIERFSRSKSEFTSALPVRGLMNSSHAVTSKRGGKADARWNAHQRTWSSTFLISCSIWRCLLETMFNSKAFLLSIQSAFWNTSGGAGERMMNRF